jgi:hypothetical protein
MRGADSFDGKISGNRQLVDRYNEAKGKKKEKSKTLGERGGAAAMGLPQRPGERGGESGGGREPHGRDEMKRIVGEHGRAVSHTVHDRGEGHPDGRYHLTTQHEDGHVAHSDHDNLEEAHAHAAIAHEDTGHLGDMGKDDYQVAREDERAEDTGGRTSNVGFMS